MSFDVYIFRPKNSKPFEDDDLEKQISTIPDLQECEESDSGYVIAGTKHIVEFYVEDEMLDEMKEEGWDAPLLQLAQSPIISASIRLDLHDAAIAKYANILESLANKLNAKLFDPQTDQVTSTDQLIKSWAGSKSFADSALNTYENRIMYLPDDKLEYIKKYMDAIPLLNERWVNSDVFVPKIFAITSTVNKSAFTCAVWPDCIFQVFPEVDYLYIQRKASGLSGLLGKKTTGYIRFEALRNELSNLLERQNTPVPHYVYKAHGVDHKLMKIVMRLPMEPDNRFEIRPIA